MSNEGFSGCYLLRSKVQQYRHACYVGFTVDPPHRLKQHNGELVGGAFKTHSKRPWEMTLVVYGFPTRKYALKFEYMWQHPMEAKCLKHVDWPAINSCFKSQNYERHIRILKEMLNSLPWCRLSLRVCVTVQDVFEMLHTEPHVPDSVNIHMGQLTDLPLSQEILPTPGHDVPSQCAICSRNKKFPVSDHPNWVTCPFCSTFLHLHCLARLMISQSPNADSALIPIRVICPVCKESLRWRDIVELRNQFYDENLESNIQTNDKSNDNSNEEL